MAKVFIIPELHMFDKSFEGRIDYPGEIQGYFSVITEEIQQQRLKGEICYIIFPGDLCHRGFTSIVAFIRFTEWCTKLNALVDGNLYSVVGNHELTYYKDNPFWMACTMNSKYFEPLRYIPGFGIVENGIRVVDELVVDNTLFVFGHYGRTDYDYGYDAYDDVQFISHNAVMDAEIRDTLTHMYHRDTKSAFVDYASLRAEGTFPLTSKLSAVYFGHMHMAYGHFGFEERVRGVNVNAVINYLGSLGRTSSPEVDDNDLKRIVYVVDTVKGATSELFIDLLPRAKCIKESVVSDNHLAYEKTKAYTKLKESNQKMMSPVSGIQEWLSETPADYSLFMSIYERGVNEDIDELILCAKGE
ncbi:MAG: metallophosphoesterase [Clostridia bacterium]